MTTDQTLSFTTIQAPNQAFIIHDLARYLAQRMGVVPRFINNLPWEERQVLIDSGEIDVAWICGLPYVVRADRGHPNIELLAAPVMAGERYNNRPIYFSDVIVRKEQSYQDFTDLRGSNWAYNEPGSQSGYNITRYHLAKIGAQNPFFNKVIEAGSHERSIQLVMDSSVDAAAIDSTVLEIARERDVRINNRLRVLTTLGPSPIPPLVISKQIDVGLRNTIKTLIMEMHKDDRGRQILERGKIRRFESVTDKDYDPIRDMARIALDVQL